MFEYLGVFLTIVLIIIVAIIYNVLSKERTDMKDAYSVMEINLFKRWNLVSEFLEFVKNYSIYEDSIIEKLSELKKEKYDTLKLAQKLEADKKISKVVDKMFDIADNNLELKSNEYYIQLKQQLNSIEKDIANSKNNYKKIISKYNNKINKFPNNIVAILFGFNEETNLNLIDKDEKEG